MECGGVKRAASAEEGTPKLPKLEMANLDTLITDCIVHLNGYLDMASIRRLGRVCQSLRKNVRQAIQIKPQPLNVSQFCAEMVNLSKRQRFYGEVKVRDFLAPWISGIRTIDFGGHFRDNFAFSHSFITKALEEVQKWTQKPTELAIPCFPHRDHILAISEFTELKKLSFDDSNCTAIYPVKRREVDTTLPSLNSIVAMLSSLQSLVSLKMDMVQEMSMDYWAALPSSLQHLRFMTSKDRMIRLLIEDIKVYR